MTDDRRERDEGTSWNAGWDDQAANAFEASLAATPLQRLEWLEEAIALAWAGREARRLERERGRGQAGPP